MPYYSTGDYYGRGDYYQGDGILSGIGRAIVGIAKVGVGAGLGLITGGPKGAITGAVGAGVQVAKSATAMATLMAGSMPEQDAARVAMINAEHARLMMNAQTMPTIAAPNMLALGPGGVPSFGPVAMMTAGGMMAPSGYRVNKSTYAVRGGGTSRWGAPGMVRLIPKGSVLVKSRRMNVANGRALQRGLKRARAFAKVARRVLVAVKKFKTKGRKR